MQAIRGTHTQPEIIVRRLLHRLGFRFRLHRKDLPGRPDIVLPKLKTAIFVHGCFWHGHNCKRGSAKRRPKSNVGYWNAKLDRNIARDAINAKKIAKLGWKRMVIWACETENTNRLASRLQMELLAS